MEMRLSRKSDRKDSRQNQCMKAKINIDYANHVIDTEIGDYVLPIILFDSEAVLAKANASMRHLGETFHLTFKLVHTECKIVKALLLAYGFHEVHPNNPDFNLTWSNSHVKVGSLRSLTEFQKVNHFPRSFELTRKDRLYKNIQLMQRGKDVLNGFDFIPQSFLIPVEYSDFCSEFQKWRGLWIVKPLALSRGRGIYLISRPEDLPVDESVLVAKYIDNPFLINGYKFDLRLYVAVTSFDPLVIYLHKEGLARFATEKYKKGIRHLSNQCMHLTNYSVNRHSANYVRCYDPNVEDYGNKWSLSALMFYLEKRGFNTTALCAQIRDIVVKAIVSAGSTIAAACRSEVPNYGNCFELFGFDILLDDTLRPWLLEINFSPSLACDLPLDLKIKSKVVTDLLNLTGVVAHDPLLLRFQRKIVSNNSPSRTMRSRFGFSMGSTWSRSKHKRNKTQSQGEVHCAEALILKAIEDESERRGNFLRIFPTANTWELYGQYLDAKTSFNSVLHKALFPSVCKFTFTDVYRGSKGLYSCLKLKDIRSQCNSGKLKFAKKVIDTALRKQDSCCDKSESSTYNSTSTKTLTKSNQLKNEFAAAVDDLARTSIHDSCPVIRLLRMDETLSQVQARQAFALYLYRVGQKLDTEMSNMSGQHSRQSSVHFQQQLDIVLQFLQYASANLTNEITIEPPDVEQTICDQGSHVLNEMNRFLEAYEDETECMRQAAGHDVREYFVDAHVFLSFLESAKVSELEEVLMIVAEHHSISWFIGANHGSDTHVGSPLATNSEGVCHLKPELFQDQSSSTPASSSLTDFTEEDDDAGISSAKTSSYSRIEIRNRALRIDRPATSSSSLSSFCKLCKAARIYTS